MTRGMSGRVSELTAARVPFVHATVVRAQVPSSARAGDDAVVLSDGSIEGFVGGQCAEGSVRTAALSALHAGQSVLLRVLSDGEDGFPESPGATVVVNPCLSGGALEIFLEPMLPPPVVEVVGQTPIAEAVAGFADLLGYQVARSLPSGAPEAGSVVVVASHGRDEIESIRSALDVGVGYVALVASRRRGAAVLSELGLSELERSRVHTPAGLDIGARTAPEVALSILAEVVSFLRAATDAAGQTAPAAAPPAPVIAVDPVCGMSVTVGADTPSRTVDGTTSWFCNPRCRDTYAAAASAK